MITREQINNEIAEAVQTYADLRVKYDGTDKKWENLSACWDRIKRLLKTRSEL